jgi:hypothetical protein|tara:strand:- start:8187 stop:9218 length:1032 start_codon:yes stop_codon:yes gene_type:complete
LIFYGNHSLGFQARKGKAMISRRRFLGVCAFGSWPLYTACGNVKEIIASAIDKASQDIKSMPRADMHLTGNRSEDIRQAVSANVQNKLRAIAQGSGEEFVIGAKTADQTWETISLSRAQGNIGGVGYAHPQIRIGDKDPVHASVDWAGGFLGIGKTIALQFRDAEGRLLGQNGQPTDDPDNAMSWSIFTGSHSASSSDLDPAGKIAIPSEVSGALQDDGGDGFADNLTQIFGIVIGAFLAFTVLKWIIGIVAFLAMQFLLFLAAAAAIGAIVFLLNNLFGIDLTTGEGRNEFVEFLRQLFNRLIQAAEVVFNSAKEFLDGVNFDEWPPQIPEGAFDNLLNPLD